MFIIGYMASGKTTFAKALARETGKQFIDLDFYIEQRYRKSIVELFAERGEEGFRTLEAAMLREVGEFEDVIIACGGGTPCFHNNMDYMLAQGDVLWLDTPIERIVERIIINSKRRPLMRGKSPEEIAQTAREGLEARLPYYSRANIRFSGEKLETKAEIADSIREFLGFRL